MLKRLLNDRTLQFAPSLAALIGLNEAIVLQQIHYWLEVSGHHRGGQTWIYNSYSDWEAQFPFMSRRELIRTMKNLEQADLIMISRMNKRNWDMTNWYAINYEEVVRLEGRLSQILSDAKRKNQKAILARKHRNKLGPGAKLATWIEP